MKLVDRLRSATGRPWVTLASRRPGVRGGFREGKGGASPTDGGTTELR